MESSSDLGLEIEKDVTRERYYLAFDFLYLNLTCEALKENSQFSLLVGTTSTARPESDQGEPRNPIVLPSILLYF